MMHAVLDAADALGEPLVALLGNPDYYRRFGFVPAQEYARWFPKDPPARSAAKLGAEIPGLLVSIRMTAFVA